MRRQKLLAAVSEMDEEIASLASDLGFGSSAYQPIHSPYRDTPPRTSASPGTRDATLTPPPTDAPLPPPHTVSHSGAMTGYTYTHSEDSGDGAGGDSQGGRVLFADAPTATGSDAPSAVDGSSSAPPPVVAAPQPTRRHTEGALAARDGVAAVVRTRAATAPTLELYRGRLVTADERRRLIAVDRFNRKPRDGVRYMEEHGMLEHDAAAHAQHLHNAQGLSHWAKGEYLGMAGDFHTAVLAAFVQDIALEGMNMLEALRTCLSYFQLPGDANCVERVMEAFAAHWVAQNPGHVANADTVFVVAYALIMLQTNMHNANVPDRDKMSEEQFISQLRGVDNGSNLDPDMLRAMYAALRDHPLQISPEEAERASATAAAAAAGIDLTAARLADRLQILKKVFQNPERRGYLYKHQDTMFRSWRRRWFVLSQGCLYYFLHEHDTLPQGIIKISSLIAQPHRASSKHPHAIRMVSCQEGGRIESVKMAKGRVMVQRNHDELILAHDDPHVCQAWLDDIARHTATLDD